MSKIPKTVRVAGSVIRVCIEDKIDYPSEDGTTPVGLYDQDACKIHLALFNCDGDRISESRLMLTYYHELTHAILCAMGEAELSENERFVEGFANYMHQALR